MAYDKALIAAKLRRWEKYLQKFRLPSWEEIPDIGLYMEQVVSVLKDYLDYLPPELKEEQIITSSTINNYVRTQKQTLSIAMVQRLIPMGLSEEEVRHVYESYVNRHQMASQYFLEQVRLLSGNILDHEGAGELAANDASELIATSVIVSGFSKLLAEKLILLDNRTLEEMQPKSNPK